MIRDRTAGAFARPADPGAFPIGPGQLMLWSVMAAVCMLFAGFTSAYLVRQSTGSDWQPLPFPPLLWWNTAVLLVSSVTLETSRLALRRGLHAVFRRRLLVSLLLGMLFMAGQLYAWQDLAERGVYVPSHPHSAFFYILTGAHGVHLLGGVLALAWVLLRSRRGDSRPLDGKLKRCTSYWHFMGVLWVYLLGVLFLF